MSRLISIPLVVFALLLPGCIAFHQPSGRLEPLTAASATELCCTPLLLAVFGRDDTSQAVVGGGSGIAVDDRVILTAGHVIPDEARFVVVRAAGAEPPANDDPRRRQWGRGTQGFRIRRVIRGGGDATTEGDWALIILDRPLTRIGARTCTCLCSQVDLAPPPGAPVIIAGYPFPASLTEHGQEATDEEMTDREPVLVRTVLSTPPPANGARGTGARDAFLYADYAAGRTDLSGLSGGPVFLAPRALGEPPVLIGIHIATGVSRFGQMTLSRTAVVRRLPLDAIQKAIADLPPLSSAPPSSH